MTAPPENAAPVALKPEIYPVEWLENWTGCGIDNLDAKTSYNVTGTHLKEILQAYRAQAAQIKQQQEEIARLREALKDREAAIIGDSFQKIGDEVQREEQNELICKLRGVLEHASALSKNASVLDDVQILVTKLRSINHETGEALSADHDEEG